ncbi:MAG TPA: AAA family ATPase [Pilimelia sp.]|nr:AAA family ATPase [Pilimelia sp.]
MLGRDAELATLRAAVASLAEGRGGIVWIEGEPGIGKSTLVGAALAGAAERRCPAYRAVGHELGQHLPLRALIDALGTETASDVVELLHGGAAGTLIDGPPAVSGAVERFLALMDRLCATQPVLLAFDDLQWADEASLLVWQRLSAAVDQIPLLLVSGCRPVPVRPAVASLRRNVIGRSAEMIMLDPLRGAEIADLVGRLTGASPGPRLRRTVAHAGGNPLYVRELVDAFTREDRVRVDGGVAELVGAQVAAPPALGSAIRDRLDFLSAAATSALRMAAFLGTAFSVYDLVTITGRQAGELLPVLDEAIAAGVLAESGDRLEFRHELIRQALYDATPASARSALHRQIARALAEAGLPIDRVAVHLMSAPDAVDGWAMDWLAEHAVDLAFRAPDLAADLLAGAAHRCAADDPRHERLLHGQARALLILMRLDDAEAVARHALASAPDPATAAEMAWVLSAILIRGGRFAEAQQVLDTAMELPDLPPLWQARLRAWRAKTLSPTSRRAEGEAEAREAVAAGERIGDAVTLGHALQMLYMLSDYETGLEYVDRALDVIGDHPETTNLRLALLANRAENVEALGRPDLAELSLREALMLAERAGASWLPGIHVELARFYLLTGRWDEAWTEIEPLTANLGYVDRLIRLGGLAFIAAHRDDRVTSQRFLTVAATLPEPTGDVRGNATLLWMARAVDAEQRGGPARAAAVLAHTVSDEDRHEIYDRCLWLPDLVRLALAAGDPGLARAAAAAAEVDAAHEALPRRVGAARRARAMIDGDAAALLAVARDLRAGGSSLALGQTCEEAAVLLARAGDVAGARAALTDAVRAYLDLGAGWDVRRADARLREYGVRRGPRSVRRRPSRGWEALTPTETRVAAMVAQGRSNPDIAAEMLLSRRTVQSHVSSILAKLGFGSRMEIARDMARQASGADSGLVNADQAPRRPRP